MVACGFSIYLCCLAALLTVSLVTEYAGRGDVVEVTAEVSLARRDDWIGEMLTSFSSYNTYLCLDLFCVLLSKTLNKY
ncbi:hypothetical protein Bpfe_001935 [Biomphalaria pfeifferi]|uniref:Uncharacterized protein n=1 Tax=Biomphalaria pfeifferi TaxID=112525 RepID=A0AAD8FL35_BIOPF|nr:hypothetical protein Bpfe_001935 [Biomphalaria pfeifferi]